MSFYPLYATSHTISPAVRGLARLIESGTWIHWMGDGGAWRGLSPSMAAKWGQSLDFSKVDRDVRWPKGMGWECHPLSAAEKELLYAIYERVYLIPERELVAAQRKAESEEAQRIQQAWLQELEQVGSAA